MDDGWMSERKFIEKSISARDNFFCSGAIRSEHTIFAYAVNEHKIALYVVWLMNVKRNKKQRAKNS